MATAETLEKKLGHRFTDVGLLSRALRHASLNIDDDNEALEFVGDRVLGLAISQILIERYPDEPEGALSRRLSQLVSGKACAQIAKAWELAPLIKTDSGMKSRDKLPDAILADACEALLGAVFLDAGFDVARNIIAHHWAAMLDAQGDAPVDAKTALQEFLAKRGRELPRYEIVKKSGAAHAPHFIVSVSSALGTAEGAGRSRKIAEQQAASELLTHLKKEAGA